MSKELIIKKTLKAIHQLPEEKAEEISDFADFVFKRYEENLVQTGINKMVAESKAFEFLENEEELYAVSDLKVVYND
jgi:hypothetical protein